MVLPRFLGGALPAGPPGAPGAPASFPFEVPLLPSKPLSSFYIQPEVHDVSFEALAWVLRGGGGLGGAAGGGADGGNVTVRTGRDTPAVCLQIITERLQQTCMKLSNRN